MLLLDLCHIGVGARKAYAQLVAQTEGGVVPSVERDRRDREIGSPRKLRSDQPSREGRSDLRLHHRDDAPSIAMRSVTIFSQPACYPAAATVARTSFTTTSGDSAAAKCPPVSYCR